nr:MAG TPA: Protein involved in cell division [Caudoviricetes sp.]
MAELNIIHPFRDGNGRSTRELIRCMALEYGLPSTRATLTAKL